MYLAPRLPLCPHCHEPTSPADLDGLTDEAARAGDLHCDAEVCRACRRTLEARAEEYALDDDPAFAEVCDERHAGYVVRLEAWLESLVEPEPLPWSLAWCEADALTPAVSL